MRVLIVEDDPTCRKILQTSLRSWGYDVVIAENGEEGWQVVNEPNPPRLCLVDREMPIMGGIELCEKIRSEDDKRRFYLIFLTVRSSPQDIKEGFEAGADDYATKPFDEVELRSRVGLGRRVIELGRVLENGGNVVPAPPKNY